MSVQLLIHPVTHEVAAELTETVEGQKEVFVRDRWLLQILTANGITVPKGFADHRYRIYPTDNPKWFAEAFETHCFKHGLMQSGFYWIKQEDYVGPEGEVQKAVDRVLKTINT